MSAVSELRPQSAFGAVRPAIGTAAADVARSLWPRDADAWLTLAELQLAYRGVRYAAPVVIVAALAVTEAVSDWVDWNARMSWWLAVTVTSLLLSAVLMRLDRTLAVTPAEIRTRAVWQTLCTAVMLGVWCSMGVWLWVAGTPLDHMLLALFLAASLSGSVTLGAAHPATALVVILTHAVFLVVPFALSSEPLDHALAWSALAFVTMMTAQAVVLHGSVRKMLTLEHERTGLVEDLRAAKQESDREHDRAVAAGRTKSQFLSNMNHELRTPMNAILGFSELIMQKAFGGAVDKYAEYAGIIHDSGQNLLRLIDDMLDLSKIEGGKLSLRESEFDLAQLLTDIRDENEIKAAELQLSLLKKVTPGLPKIRADERALRQILANLVSNALKFTPPGGCITLFAQREDDGRIAFGVDDTGIGIAEDSQAQIFERFGQGRHDVTSADKGTGLGLAIVKGFAEAHDGEVGLESALGAGTRVIVWLPVERIVTPEMLKTA
ncbi:MAG TPA: HAMP domain-containing sensor histidine kinase [Rhizomicrobium sp.]|nr:HAMP domain-containing sensor histidine kinase [Rhizomicrobium sp.]